MGTHVIKLPDVGEGVAEAELVEWLVKVGEPVAEDDIIGAVMTDKATVEIPSPVNGTISWLGAEIGDTVSVGADLIKLEVSGDEQSALATELENEAETVAPVIQEVAQPEVLEPKDLPNRANKFLASPAVRKRIAHLKLDPKVLNGTGVDGIVAHEDVDRHIMANQPVQASHKSTLSTPSDNATNVVKVVGLRRKIAEQMVRSSSEIPHITYVEEIDVTELENLRLNLNNTKDDAQPKLSLLPFFMRAIAIAIRDQPDINAHYDSAKGEIHQIENVNIGIATQTESGLMVPVVRNTQSLGLWDSAREISRLAAATRDGSASREELSGSSITITSLGKIGGIVTTPIINHPEVAIIGINKIRTDPMWNGAEFVPRKVMNLSSSFDHRAIDGWGAAMFVQRIKSLIEKPLLIFS